MAVERRKKEPPSKDTEKKKKPHRAAASENVIPTLFVTRMTMGSIAVAILIIYGGVILFSNARVTHLLPGFAVKDAPEFNTDTHISKYLWGSYRPQVYFGMRAKTPTSPLLGMMYFSHHSDALRLRHTCENSDRMKKFGWERHDGSSFGQQTLHDEGGFVMHTEFVKTPGDRRGGSFTARVKGEWEGQSGSRYVSVIFYTAAQGNDNVELTELSSLNYKMEGKADVIGRYGVDFPYVQSRFKAVHYWGTRTNHVHNLTELVKGAIAQGMQTSSHMAPMLPDTMRLQPGERSNFVAVQFTVQFPFVIDMTFSPLKPDGTAQIEGLHGRLMDHAVKTKEGEFDLRFEDTFSIGPGSLPKWWGDTEVGDPTDEERFQFARAAFSNLIGGIGYFYGQTKVISPHSGAAPHLVEAAPLLTAVPSRTYFPRGFLWDEGFHQLVIQRWDMTLSREILAHWFDLINVDGWIAREQILGEEALAKVPEQFVVQNDHVANPPALLLAIDRMLDTLETSTHRTDDELQFFARLLPRVRLWLKWFNTTQSGEDPLTYRWHGRDPLAVNELNPKTLASGLDDYPRASHPGEGERHVDLWCWMNYGVRVVARMARLTGDPVLDQEEKMIEEMDSKLLDRLHWSAELGHYADYGNDTSDVQLVEIEEGDTGSITVERRVIGASPRPRFVPHFGYVSLFPILLDVVNSQSDQLGATLDLLSNPMKLWTDFGLRSLSQDSTFYLRHNTPADKPYWRGPVWININYLTVRALQRYAARPGPHASRANELSKQLRHNLSRNMVLQYNKTGYVWENYDVAYGHMGHGQGSHPFTGWSALAVLLLGDN